MGKNNSKLQGDILEDLCRTTLFNEEEILLWHKGFMTDCPSGRLSLEGFRAIYKNFFPSGDVVKFADIVFEVFDENNDGLIDFKEYVSALSVTSRGNLEDKLEWSFKLYDLDKDGFISRDELLQVVQATYLMVGETVQLAEDENTPEKRVEKIFNAMDLDKDNKISLDEFLEGAKCDASIIQALCLFDNMNSRSVVS